MFYTYIIYSQSRDRYYTGYTSVKVEKCLERHNTGWTRSTKSEIPWKLKYYKSFESKKEALEWSGRILLNARKVVNLFKS